MPLMARAPGSAASRPTFSDRLQGKLELVIGADTFSFPVGSLERILIKATVYGFEADIVVGVVCGDVPDPVFASFTKSDLITATLTLANGNEGYADEQALPWTLRGPVTWRRLVETTSDEKTGIPVVLRKYSLRFHDPARVFWKRHHPVELFTGISMKDVIAAYLPSGMQIDGGWSTLDEALDMICIGNEKKLSFCKRFHKLQYVLFAVKSDFFYFSSYFFFF